MKAVIGLTKRNILVFFKDKQTIVFSLLTSIIILVLYLSFLKGTFVGAMNNAVNKYPEVASLVGHKEIDMFANLILLAGILGSAMVTVSYHCLTIFVKDRENKVDYDILATPMKRGQIVLSYFISAAISSVILTSVILMAGLLVIGMQGKTYLEVGQIIKIFGIVVIGSVSATSIFMIIILFFKSVSACGAFSGILSAASGFVIGAYIPISQFSSEVQTVCNLFPASQVTIVLRNLLINGLLQHIDHSLGGTDQGMLTEGLKELFSFKARLFNGYFDVSHMMVYILLMIIVCIVIQIFLYKKTYKKV